MADLVGTDIITSVQGLVDDDQYSEALILEAANWFVNELYNGTRTRRMETSDELFASSGDTEMEGPEDMQTLLNLSVTTPTPARNIMDNYMEYADFARSYPNFAGVTSSIVREWTDFANGFRFSAPLNADHTFFVEYLREPVPMEADTDDCEVKATYGELVSKGTLARLLEINEDYEEAREERKNLVPLIAVFKRNEGRGQMKVGPTVIRTNRGHRRGGWTTNDF